MHFCFFSVVVHFQFCSKMWPKSRRFCCGLRVPPASGGALQAQVADGDDDGEEAEVQRRRLLQVDRSLLYSPGIQRRDLSTCRSLLRCTSASFPSSYISNFVQKCGQNLADSASATVCHPRRAALCKRKSRMVTTTEKKQKCNGDDFYR